MKARVDRQQRIDETVDAFIRAGAFRIGPLGEDVQPEVCQASFKTLYLVAQQREIARERFIEGEKGG